MIDDATEILALTPAEIADGGWWPFLTRERGAGIPSYFEEEAAEEEPDWPDERLVMLTAFSKLVEVTLGPMRATAPDEYLKVAARAWEGFGAVEAGPRGFDLHDYLDENARPRPGMELPYAIMRFLYHWSLYRWADVRRQLRGYQVLRDMSINGVGVFAHEPARQVSTAARARQPRVRQRRRREQSSCHGRAARPAMRRVSGSRRMATRAGPDDDDGGGGEPPPSPWPRGAGSGPPDRRVVSTDRHREGVAA